MVLEEGGGGEGEGSEGERYTDSTYKTICPNRSALSPLIGDHDSPSFGLLYCPEVLRDFFHLQICFDCFLFIF